MSIDSRIIGFLDTIYGRINKAALFEKTAPYTSYDDSGNRTHIEYAFSTGQFTEGFDLFYEKHLSLIFGHENVICSKNDVNPDNISERLFVFQIFGDQDELVKKIDQWETQGIQKSSDNQQQLIDLVKTIENEIADKNPIEDIYLGTMGGVNDVVVIKFSHPFIENDYNQSMDNITAIFSARGGGLISMGCNKDNQIDRFFLHLDKKEPLEFLRSASRNGYRLNGDDTVSGAAKMKSLRIK